jgi:hypothetical protein
VSVAACWFGAAMLIGIPASRAADGLGVANPLLESRFGSPEGHLDPGLAVDRVLSTSSIRRIANLVAMTGGLAVVGGVWLIPALPGIAISLAAAPDTMQAGLTGHYAWPILPWLFLAASWAVIQIEKRAPRLARVWVLLLLGATLIDNPAVRRLRDLRVAPEARAVRTQLAGLRGTVILAQPNLIPHLPHQAVYAFGGTGAAPPRTPDLVLLTEVGNLWPLTREDVAAAISRYERDERYQRVSAGPLHGFALRAGR